MAVPVGIVVSAAFILTLIYTMGARGWGLDDRKASVPTQLLGALWVISIVGGGLFLSSRCADAFGVEGSSDAAQTARLWFILIWAGMGLSPSLPLWASSPGKRKDAETLRQAAKVNEERIADWLLLRLGAGQSWL